jgi:fructose/tagatose bisphosphate aldolase
MLKSMVQGQTRKRLDIERIAQIKRATQTFLTLHGGSGTEDADLRKAIAAGINIVHVNTELRVAWRRGLEEGPCEAARRSRALQDPALCWGSGEGGGALAPETIQRRIAKSP